eukprot:g6517.t1
MLAPISRTSVLLGLAVLFSAGQAHQTGGTPDPEEVASLVANAEANVQGAADAPETAAVRDAKNASGHVYKLVSAVYVVPTSAALSPTSPARQRLQRELQEAGLDNVTEWVDDWSGLAQAYAGELAVEAEAGGTPRDPDDPRPRGDGGASGVGSTGAAALADALRFVRPAVQEELPLADRRRLRVRPPLADAQRDLVLRYAEALRRHAAAGHEAALVLTDRARLADTPRARAELPRRLEHLSRSATLSGKAFAICLSPGAGNWHLPMASKLGWFVKSPAESKTMSWGIEREEVPFDAVVEDNVMRGPEGVLFNYMGSRMLWRTLLPAAAPLSAMLNAGVRLRVVAAMWAAPALLSRASVSDDSAGAVADGKDDEAADAARLALDEAADAAACDEDGSRGELVGADGGAPRALLGALTAAAEAFPEHRAVAQAPGAARQRGFAALEAGPEWEKEALAQLQVAAGRDANAANCDAGLAAALLARRRGGGGFASEAAWRSFAESGGSGQLRKAVVGRAAVLMQRAASRGQTRMLELLLDARGGRQVLEAAAAAVAARAAERALKAAEGSGAAAEAAAGAALAAADAAADAAEGKGKDTGAAAVDLRHEDALNSTALILAARAGRAGTVRVLLSQGADAAATDEGGANALLHAASNGRAAVVRELCGGAGGSGGSALAVKGKAALHRASAAGHVHAVAALVRECGASADSADEQGNTALMYAAAACRPAVARVLLRLGGATAATRNGDGQSARDFASAARCAAVARLLPVGAAAGHRATGGGDGGRAGGVVGGVFGDQAMQTQALLVVASACFVLSAAIRLRRRRVARRCRARLEAIYREHAPEKLKELDAVVRAYAGYEPQMVAKAEKKYLKKD